MATRRSVTAHSAQSALVPTGVAILTAVGALILLTVPLPAWLVDLLLAANLAGATGLLLVALLTPRPVELSTLPSIIVLSSLARLLLALAVARLVVTIGQPGPFTMTLAAVAGFHNPVASLGSLLTLAVVQFVVVTAGVTRIAEVAARFALDALPGKQLILETTARTKAESSTEPDDTVAHLEREANFYGAMDGAARFLRGETIAKTMQECGIEEKVEKKIAVLPGGVAVLSGDLEQESGWNVVVGPRESAGIPTFFKTEYEQRIADFN